MGKKTVFYLSFFVLIVFASCYRNDIQFGSVPDNGYTKIVYNDTVQARLSTIVRDSFATNSPAGFLFGRCKDPWLGTTSAKPFLQMNSPSTVPDIPATAQYDSATIIVYLDKYYFGDTTRSFTIQANELAQPLYYSYATDIYNTSNFAVKPTPLGTRTLKIRPSIDDSILIRMNDTKGTELFSKLRSKDPQVTRVDSFLNYFYGISFSQAAADTSVIYGVSAASGKIVMRVYYHLTTPSYQSLFIDFVSAPNSYAFNQIITDRTNTLLNSPPLVLKEFPSEQTNNVAFTQYATGVMLKMTFPSLKSILQSNNIVKLLRADILVKPVGQTYNGFFSLPSPLAVFQTDATNTIGPQLYDSTGITYLNIPPVIDAIYGINTYYRFNITAYVDRFLNTPGTESSGFFIMNRDGTKLNRAVVGNIHNAYQTQLQLTYAVIAK